MCKIEGGMCLTRRAGVGVGVGVLGLGGFKVGEGRSVWF